MLRRLRLFFGITGVLTVLAGFALPTDAGLLGTGTANYCDPNVSQIFKPFGDSAYYMLTPGGSFETGAPSWKLSGGAKIVSGNESFFLTRRRHEVAAHAFGLERDHADDVLPGRRLAHAVCRQGHGPGPGHDHGSSLLGLLSVLDGGTVRPGDTWTPSPKVSLLLTNVGGLLTTRAIALKFTATDGSSQIDDVYLDPFKDT